MDAQLDTPEAQVALPIEPIESQAPEPQAPPPKPDPGPAPYIAPAPVLRSRYRRIITFASGVAARVIFFDMILPRLGLRALSRRGRQARYRRIAVQFRTLAIHMGGVLIKVGQFLSSRLDVLPQEIVTELAGLQDEVPPERFEDVRALAEAELGASLAARFENFDPQPMAAASLGQAHRATLRIPDVISNSSSLPAEGETGEGVLPVVVKIQRPGIEKLIATDLAALNVVGRWLQRYEPIRRRVDVPALIGEFTRVLYEELDYITEGHHAETFAANFEGRAGVRIPGVVWSHTTRRVLTLEDVSAIKVTDYDQITAAGVDRSEVAMRLFDTYLQQVFEDGFFHADPHPGNLFVSPANGDQEWKLAFIDFGMVGRIPDNLRDGLRDGAIAIATQDGARLIRAYQRLGVLLPGADLAQLERASAQVFAEFWGRSMGELRRIGHHEMRRFTSEFRDLMYDMPFQVPEDLIMLGRTMALLSGMCTGLDPDFNVWISLEPYARKLIAEEAGGGLNYWLGELTTLAQGVIGLPRQTGAVLSKLERGDLSISVPDISRRMDRLESAVRNMMGGVMFAAMLLGGVQLVLAGVQPLGDVLMGGSALALIWVIAAGRRRGS